jgi:hypothetical protein
MNKSSTVTVAVVGLGGLAVAGLGLAVFSFGVTKKTGQDTMRAVQSLERRLRTMEMQLAQMDPRRGPPPGNATGKRPPPPGGMSGPTGQPEAVTAEALAAGKVSPEVLSRMSEHYLRMENITKLQRTLVQRNREQHRADMEKYGQKVMDLYAAARPAGEDATAKQASDEALSTLVSQYPEANATAMALAERALSSALDQNSADALEYYNQLKSNPAYADVVTDNGVEAIPALQSFLVQDYLSKGQTDQARAVIADMKNNYADSVILDRTPDSMEPTWRTVSEVAANLERLIDAGGGAPPPPPGQ